MKRSRMKRKSTKRSPEGASAMAAFGQRWGKQACWFCGRKQQPALDKHHIIHRRGKEYDDQRNLAAVCRICHRRIHGDTVVLPGGRRLLPISLDDVLAAKQRFDSRHYDLTFLEQLNGQPLDIDQ